MVDNENQWEDTEGAEYIDNSDPNEEYADDGVDEDYSDQEYEAYDDSDEEMTAQPKSNMAGCVVLILLLLLVAAGAVFFILPKIKNSSGTETSTTVQTETATTQVSETEQNTEDIGDMFFNEAGGDSTDMMSVDFNSQTSETTAIKTQSEPEAGTDTTAIEIPVAQNTNGIEVPATNANQQVDDLFSQDNITVEQSQGSDEILVSYNKSARLNPFKPPVVSKQEESYTLINNTEFEIIEPPLESVEDENLTRLLQTQISGILFDDESPSAIVNLNGADQFVKIGDVVSGYTIEDITKDKVQIRYKNNSYVASVGELFTKGALEKNPAVTGLENKFAGRYKN